MIRPLNAAAVLAAILVLGGSLSAKATVSYNASLAAPGVYFGNGNANSNFTVDTENGVELGLSAITRYIGPIVPSPSNSNVYDVPLGATTVAGKTGSAWGFDFSINLQPPGGSSLTLGDITALLTLTDVVNGTTGSFDPFAGIPDNTAYGPSGKQSCGGACAPADWAVQNSEALSFGSINTAFGDPLYNMNAMDTYIITLTVSGPGGQLASDTIVVNAVPEPTSMALFATGLAGLGMLRRRRRRAA